MKLEPSNSLGWAFFAMFGAHPLDSASLSVAGRPLRGGPGIPDSFAAWPQMLGWALIAKHSGVSVAMQHALATGSVGRDFGWSVRHNLLRNPSVADEMKVLVSLLG